MLCFLLFFFLAKNTVFKNTLKANLCLNCTLRSLWTGKQQMLQPQVDSREQENCPSAGPWLLHWARLCHGGQRWGLCLLPVMEPQLSSQSAANLKENPSLSLLHLCLSHQTTATTEESFPFSCEHLPPNASYWDDFLWPQTQERRHRTNQPLKQHTANSCWKSNTEGTMVTCT